ncbi:MAG: hypothetical protein ACP5LM_04150 [Thermoplasmata archaeon]
MSDIMVFDTTNTANQFIGMSATKLDGIQALVQEVILQIMTPLGTYPGDSSYGSDFFKLLRQYNGTNENEIKAIITTELIRITNKVKKNQLGYVSDPRRKLANIKLVSLNLSVIPAEITIAVTNALSQMLQVKYQITVY